ncbi:MAG: TolC family protein [Cyclobacteriaceae bacterium]|nr:TolC family protein [Cyclobacteriaceae bacterium]UYN86698.1 MAG: TolC family protein [Cyclobacteriaceae bacterium]
MMRSKVLFFFLLGILNHATGQRITDDIFTLPDTARPFTIENFYFLVIGNHPIAKQTRLLSDVARQEIRLARGNFDPKIEVQYLKKEFGETEYYQVFNGGVSVPTILPFDPKIGVERNEGQYLNPERFIANDFNFRQFYAGISMPLGRGLITDERRIALRQAELFQDLTEAEQVKQINYLLLSAAKDYWSWYNAYYNFRLLAKGVEVANEIFLRTKINAELGEAAAIDTVQAKITLQQRLIEQQEAILDFQNTGIILSTYLWDSLSNPLALTPSMVPVLQRDLLVLTALELNALTEQARANHPELRKLSIKLLQLENERRLAAEFLKPRLDVNYSFLNQPFDPDWNTNFSLGNNYKFGLDFSFPVLLRKERSKLALTRLKISGTQYERNMAERQIVNDVNATHNMLVNTAAIMNNQTDMVNNYERLLQAEILNFENGESDLFRINIQQERLIQAQTKLVKLMADYEKQKAMLYWAAGVRNLGAVN